MQTLYPDWKKQAAQLAAQETQLDAIRPTLEVLRALDPVVAALFDALIAEIEQAKAPTKALESSFAKFDAAKDAPAARAVGDAIVTFERHCERVQRTNEVLNREKEWLAQKYPLVMEKKS
jgi:hypothetical protein